MPNRPRWLVIVASFFVLPMPALALPGDPIEREPGEAICALGATRPCANSSGCTGHKTCVQTARGPRWGVACTGGGSVNCACAAGAVASCQPAAGGCGKKTCAADGNSFGACNPFLCGACTPGDP